MRTDCYRTSCSDGVQTRRVRGSRSGSSEGQEYAAKHHNRVHVRQRVAVVRQFRQEFPGQRHAQLGLKFPVQRCKYT